jgi:hypothetical protein
MAAYSGSLPRAAAWDTNSGLVVASVIRPVAAKRSMVLTSPESMDSTVIAASCSSWLPGLGFQLAVLSALSVAATAGCAAAGGRCCGLARVPEGAHAAGRCLLKVGAPRPLCDRCRVLAGSAMACCFEGWCRCLR